MSQLYEEKARTDLERWIKKIESKGSITAKFAKSMQTKINSRIPEKVHNVFTTSIKNMVYATLVGSQYTTKTVPLEKGTLEEREQLLQDIVKGYKKTAALEGIGTGAGGIFLGMADFPLLLSIKIKFLFEVANIYGFDTKDYRERIYILLLFQLAFSSEQKRKDVLHKLKNWERFKLKFPEKEKYLEEIDWKEFQLEYRDHIDLLKLFQLVPGFGAIVGGLANSHFLEVLGETAKNGYRLRIFVENEK